MAKAPKNDADIVPPADLPTALGMSRPWTYAHLQAGNIRSLRMGRYYRVTWGEVKRVRAQGLPVLHRPGNATGKRRAAKPRARTTDPLA